MKQLDHNLYRLPLDPRYVYSQDNDWKSFGCFLGIFFCSDRYREILPFKVARNFVRKLKLKSQGEWQEYCKSGKKPVNIPSLASVVYKNRGWTSWNDFLGTNGINPVKKKLPPFLCGGSKNRGWVSWSDLFKGKE